MHCDSSYCVKARRASRLTSSAAIMVLMGLQNNKRAQESEEKFWPHAQRLERDPFIRFLSRCPLWVQRRNTRCDQMFSALPPITDILGGRLARLSSGGREYFHSECPLASALPAPEQTDKVLRSPCRLETG